MTYSAEVLADTPVVYYRLGDASGTVAADSSGNSRPGTYVGSPTLGTTGLLTSDSDKAVSFDGVDDQVTIPANTAGLDLTAAWSLEAIVKVNGSSGGSGIVTRDYNGSNTVQYELGVDPDTGTAKFTIGFYNGSWRVAMNATVLTVGTVYHLVGTWDGTILRLYVNGTQVATNTPGSSPNSSGTAQTYRIGRRHDTAGSQNFFNGVIDEVAIYNVALSAARVTAHYNASVAVGGATFTITPISPLYGSQTSQTSPTFTVRPDSSDSSAMTIQWEWDDDPNFANANGRKKTKTTTGNADNVNASTTPTSALTGASVWYWRARAGDGTNFSAFTTGQKLTIVTAPATANATRYMGENLGFTQPSVSFAGLYMGENIGIFLGPFDAATGMTENVTTGAPTPELWLLIPSYGRSGDHVTVIGAGLGSTQAQYSGVIWLKDSALLIAAPGILSWTLVAAVPGQAFPYSVEHNEIVIVIPDAISDGMASIYGELNV